MRVFLYYIAGKQLCQPVGGSAGMRSHLTIEETAGNGERRRAALEMCASCISGGGSVWLQSGRVLKKRGYLWPALIVPEKREENR